MATAPAGQLTEDLPVIHSGPVRILLVDDDVDAALLATHMLAKPGRFTVVHTPDPAAALQLIARGDCDLVLTETELPGLTARELITAIRQFAPGLPIVVLTAHLHGTAEARALRELTDAYLEKPVPPARLITTITTALSRPS